MKKSICSNGDISKQHFFYAFMLTKYGPSSSALPDLVLDTDLLKGHMEINVLPLFGLRCAMEENCLSKSAASQLR